MIDYDGTIPYCIPLSDELKKELISRRVRSITFKDFHPKGEIVSVMAIDLNFDHSVVWVKWDDIEENRHIRNKIGDEELRFLVPEERFNEYLDDLRKRALTNK